MDAGQLAMAITAIGTVITGVLGVVFKYRQDKQAKDTGVLEQHIARQSLELVRLDKQNKHKDEVIERVTYLQGKCKLQEVANYGWMERANDLMNLVIAELQSRGGPKIEPLQLPPRPPDEDVELAAYEARRAKYNSAISSDTTNAILANTPGARGDP